MKSLKSLFSSLFDEEDKPRRIIHNQAVIMTLFLLSVPAPFLLTYLLTWLLFVAFPVLLIPLITLWFISAIIYTALYIRHRKLLKVK